MPLSLYPLEQKVTGWDNGLSQDYNRELGRWFADRLGARQQLLDTLAKSKLTELPASDAYHSGIETKEEGTNK